MKFVKCLHKFTVVLLSVGFSSCTSLQGFANLLARISRLAALDPLAISITWGAGGSTRDRSLDLAEFTQSEYGIDTVMHLTCTNMEQGIVDDVLRVRSRISSVWRLSKVYAYIRMPRRGGSRTSWLCAGVRAGLFFRGPSLIFLPYKILLEAKNIGYRLTRVSLMPLTLYVILSRRPNSGNTFASA